MPAPGTEGPFVGFDETALADGRDRLEVGKLLGTRRQSHPSHAGPHGPRTDEHDASAGGEERVELPAEGLDAVGIEEAVGAGEHACADLDDKETGDVGDVLAERVGHGARWWRLDRHGRRTILPAREKPTPASPGGGRPSGGLGGFIQPRRGTGGGD